MKVSSLPKQRIVGRLWLGFGLLLFVIGLSAIIYFYHLQRINSNATQMIEVQVPLERAVLQMQNNVDEIARAVSNYMVAGDPMAMEEARDSEVRFQRVAAEFSRIAQSDITRQHSQEIDRLYKEFKGSAFESMALVNQQQSAVTLFREDINELNDSINVMLQTTIDDSHPGVVKKIQSALDMQSNLDKVSTAIEAYISEASASRQQDVLEAQEAFNRAGVTYRETGLSAYETGWLNHVGEKFSHAADDGLGILLITDRLTERQAYFEQTLGQIDTYLNEQVCPLVYTGATAASEDVQSSVASANRWLLILGVIGVLIGSGAVWILAKKVTTPIQELVAGAKAVGSGRLEHRFSIDAKDEFGQVARSLNQMLDNLSRSREALGESEELAWALLDATHDAVILMDRRGVILATNEIAAARFGKSLEQMIDETIYDIVPQGTAASLKAHIVDVIRSVKPVHYEEEREGKIIDQNMYPVLDGKGEISRIAIFSRDITMRKWVEDVTEQLGRRNDLILEAAGEGIYGLDIQGKTTFVNPAAARMLRYKPEELIGQRHHELVHHSKPDGKPYHIEQCPIYTAFKDGTVHTNVDDEVFWRKDGTSFPVEYTSTPIIEDGRILGAVVTFKDITERKRVENALQQSEEKYRSIFEAAASLIVSVDKAGIVIDCNTRIQQMLGYTQSEIIGRRLVDIFHPDEYSKIEELLNGVLIKGFEYDNQYIMLKKDGTSIKVSMNAAAATDTNGEYVRTICMINVVNPGKGLPSESSGQGERSHV